MRDPKSSYSGPNPERTSRDWGREVTRNRFIKNKSPQTNLISFPSKVTGFVAREKAQTHYTLTSNKIFDIVSLNIFIRKFGKYDLGEVNSGWMESLVSCTQTAATAGSAWAWSMHEPGACTQAELRRLVLLHGFFNWMAEKSSLKVCRQNGNKKDCKYVGRWD